ncbi:MAG: bifunctional homocysteine S-methyltransferase/methylenetetrahydrofolate reductase [Anaerolineales bacterium]|nr:bifunctional homocysteine S-methyltransferase/methylenetetrahydrofolate reductase [Anaerolineales bacterium]
MGESKKEQFQRWLDQEQILLADGAMGTMLHERGVAGDICFDALNLDQPALVADIHRSYIDAGSRIIETNSFGANRYKLDARGLGHSVKAINQQSVLLARRVIEASFRDVLVAASVGPLGVRLEPFGRIKAVQAYDAFSEQIQSLADAGADLLIFETHTDLYEIREAIRAAKAVCDLPVLASLTYTRDDRTLLGNSPAQVAAFLNDLEVDVIGANCSGGPAQLLRILQQMQQAVPGAMFGIMPNAGWPERVGGRIMYSATPEYFGEYALAYREAGARIIGGCCGTTPDHIAAMRAALENPARELSIQIPDEGLFQLPDSDQVYEPTELNCRLDAGKFVISVEMDPPRGFSTHKLLAGASLLAEAGADIINVADSPMARMRMSPWAVCQIIQRKIGIETVLHFPTRGRNILRVQGDLLAAHALGVRNIFVVMGDPTSIGDFPEAADNYDVVPSGLIKLIKQDFNSGVDHSGVEIGEATSFFAGCALNLSPRNIEREIQILRKKIAAGADFALTQPVFSREPVEIFLSAYQRLHGELEIPILLGILPLYGSRHAAFLHNEVPGIEIPESIRGKINEVGQHAPEIGVRIGIELVQEVRDLVQGVYLMPPFKRYDMAAEMIEVLRE